MESIGENKKVIIVDDDENYEEQTSVLWLFDVYVKHDKNNVVFALRKTFGWARKKCLPRKATKRTTNNGN